MKAVLRGIAAAFAPKRQSSPEMSSLAARVLKMGFAAGNEMVPPDDFNALLRHAKRLAGSVLAQDETK